MPNNTKYNQRHARINAESIKITTPQPIYVRINAFNISFITKLALNAPTNALMTKTTMRPQKCV